MSSQKEDQALGHHLLIAHGVAIFVSGLQENGEEVIVLSWVAAPLVNEASNAIVQHLFCTLRVKLS